ncbi:hypothetical protein WKH56_20715 [Priestia sp. SB1]|uniref:hypothetical protein n=1 Tax=Priestia sp. SB1 TaxID=3132359 RepID=UPI00316EC0C5
MLKEEKLNEESLSLNKDSVTKGSKFSYRDIKEFLLSKMESHTITDKEYGYWLDIEKYGNKGAMAKNRKLYVSEIREEMLEYYNNGY